MDTHLNRGHMMYNELVIYVQNMIVDHATSLEKKGITVDTDYEDRTIQISHGDNSFTIEDEDANEYFNHANGIAEMTGIDIEKVELAMASPYTHMVD